VTAPDPTYDEPDRAEPTAGRTATATVGSPVQPAGRATPGVGALLAAGPAARRRHSGTARSVPERRAEGAIARPALPRERPS
jgi:hypothetical protein